MELKITHNAGLFSCATIRLVDIMVFYNQHKRLPNGVDSSLQFEFYKQFQEEDMTPELYLDDGRTIEYDRVRYLSLQPGCNTFSDYSKLLFDDNKPFIDKYFSPSERVIQVIREYELHYDIDYDNTCAIFYRGNDKITEGDIVPYEDFVTEAAKLNESVRFLVQPDETEFLEYFVEAFPDRCFNFKETPHLKKCKSAVFKELEPKDRPQHAVNFLAAVITMSKCKHLITHSGNGGMWALLYRGNFNNVHQFITKNHIYQ